MADERSKSDVLALIGERHAEIEAVLAELGEPEMLRAGMMDKWSAKDILAHITMWEQWLLRVLRGDAEALEQLRRMRDDEGDALVNAMNAQTFAANRERALADVRAAFDASYHETLRALEALPDATLAREERVVAGNTWEHYAEHGPMLRAWRDRQRTR